MRQFLFARPLLLSSSRFRPLLSLSLPLSFAALALSLSSSPVPSSSDLSSSTSSSTTKERPGVTTVTSSSVNDLLSSSRHVLIEVFHPACHACARLSPIIDQLALIAQAVNQSKDHEGRGRGNPFVVAMMDESQNPKPSFLTEEEEEYLPVIKFFPAKEREKSEEDKDKGEGKGKGIRYDGPHNTLSILRFVNENLPERDRVSLESIREILEQTNVTTQNEILHIYQQQLKASTKLDPAMVLFDIAPCSVELRRLIQEMLLSRYRSLISTENQAQDRAERAKIRDDFSKCVTKSANATFRFWHNIATLANEQLQQSKEALEAQGIDTNKLMEKEEAVEEDEKADEAETADENEQDDDFMKSEITAEI